MSSVGRLLRARSADRAKAQKEAAKAMRQRCLCGHQRRYHAYSPIRNPLHPFHFDPSACRKCKVEGCSCPNFILLQRSIL